MSTATKCRANDPATCIDPNCPEKRAYAARVDSFFAHPAGGATKLGKSAGSPKVARISHEALSELMEFGVTVNSNGAGGVSGVRNAPYVEEVQYVDLDADGQSLSEPVAPAGWEYLKGFTNQYGYRGAVMHQSEVMGGGLAEHILDNPGDYAVVMIDGMQDPEDPEYADGDTVPVGWGVLHKLDSAA